LRPSGVVSFVAMGVVLSLFFIFFEKAEQWNLEAASQRELNDLVMMYLIKRGVEKSANISMKAIRHQSSLTPMSIGLGKFRSSANESN
jgi:hypothetical protein